MSLILKVADDYNVVHTICQVVWIWGTFMINWKVFQKVSENIVKGGVTSKRKPIGIVVENNPPRQKEIPPLQMRVGVF